ncbi:FtsX-like permease family protein [Flavobacteriaceae bacterium R38]|nr:FtsX-like permease family protein [Flavobacteriaceae bacterium R38]
MIKNYLKTAWRNLIKNKVSTLINILGLSIGISSCIVILIFIRYESTFDTHHERAKETYRVVQHMQYPNEILYWNTTAYPLAEALRNDFPEIDVITQTAGPINREFSVEDTQGNIQRFEEPQVLFADPYYTKVFDIEWLAGDQDTALKEYGSVVLTESLVKKYFGDNIQDYQSVLGRVIMLNSKDPLSVTGVVKNTSANSNQVFNMLVSYKFFKENNPFPSTNWSGNYAGTTFVVLQDEKQKNALESKIADWKKKYLKPEDDKRISYFLQPLNEIHTETLYGSSPGSYVMPTRVLRIASFAALFVLVIVIINFINLITAQSTTRSKEVGIRKVLGSSRFNVIFQFILENTLLIIVTLSLSILFVYLLLDQLNSFVSVINLDLKLSWSHVGMILLIGGVTILLAAIYPALVLSSFKPVAALKNMNVFKNMHSFTLRKSLIIFQFVIVQLFVIAAIVVAVQMNYFKSEEVGFSSEAVVITPYPSFSKLETYKTSLLQESTITEVSFGSGPPMSINGLSLGTTYRIPEEPVDEGKDSEMKVGDVNYIDFYDLELIAGRNFITTKNRFDEFIVNEKLLESYGWTPQEAIGKKLIINEGEATIVGVMRDFHNNSLQYEITPCILINWNAYQNNAFIKITNFDGVAAIDKVWNDIFTSSVYNYNFLSDAIKREYAIEQLIFNGFKMLSILAISIGCLGLFGLMSFITLRKTKEIGVRKVLGAGVMRNVTFLSKEFILLIGIAFIIAAPLVYYFMNIWLQSFTYRIELSLWMFLLGGIITLAISLITSSFQSIKAALANPIKSLQTE